MRWPLRHSTMRIRCRFRDVEQSAHGPAAGLDQRLDSNDSAIPQAQGAQHRMSRNRHFMSRQRIGRPWAVAALGLTVGLIAGCTAE